MFSIGFSYVGLVFLLMLFVPNILFAKRQPVDCDKYAEKESKALQVFERIGEVMICCCAVIFSDFNIRRTSLTF